MRLFLRPFIVSWETETIFIQERDHSLIALTVTHDTVCVRGKSNAPIFRKELYKGIFLVIVAQNTTVLAEGIAAIFGQGQ